MMLTIAVTLLPHICVVLGAFTQTRSQATLADQDDYVKHPQQQPLDLEELKVTRNFLMVDFMFCAGTGGVDWQLEQRATGAAAGDHGTRS